MSLYNPAKKITEEAYQKEFYRLLRLALARTKTFNDNCKNYYWYQLEYLEFLNSIKENNES